MITYQWVAPGLAIVSYRGAHRVWRLGPTRMALLATFDSMPFARLFARAFVESSH